MLALPEIAAAVNAATPMHAAVTTTAAGVNIGAVEPLFDVGSRLPRRHTYSSISNTFGVSADGQRFLFNLVPESTAPDPLTLVVNWPALVRQ